MNPEIKLLKTTNRNPITLKREQHESLLLKNKIGNMNQYLEKNAQ
jgi:hypothetical protein